MSTPKISGPARRGSEPMPRLLAHFRGHRDNITSLAFHPNTQTLFSAAADGFVYMWSFTKDTRALRFEGHAGAVNEVSVSAYGDLMGTCGDDGTCRIWVPTVKGQCVVVRGGHSGPVRSLQFSPVDPSAFATASNDKTAKLWNVNHVKLKNSGATRIKQHNFVASFTGHSNWVRSVRWSSDGRLLVTSSDDGTIRIHDTRKSAAAATAAVSKLTCDVGSPLLADFNPCGGRSYVGVATTARAFLLYDIRNPTKLVQSYLNLVDGDSSGSSVNGFAFHKSGDFAVTGGSDAKIKVLDLVEGRPIITLLGPRTSVNDVAFNRDGTLFATGGRDQEVLIWEPTLIPYDPEDPAAAAAAEVTAEDDSSSDYVSVTAAE